MLASNQIFHNREGTHYRIRTQRCYLEGTHNLLGTHLQGTLGDLKILTNENSSTAPHLYIRNQNFFENMSFGADLPSTPCPSTKENGGCLHCQPTHSCPTCLEDVHTFGANLNGELQKIWKYKEEKHLRDSFTGRLLFVSKKKYEGAGSGTASDPIIVNSPDQQLPENTFGKKTLLSQAPGYFRQF